MLRQTGRNTYELSSANDLHETFLKDLHELKEAQAARRETTAYGFSSGALGTGIIEFFAIPKIKEQVQKFLDLQGIEASEATGYVIGGGMIAGGVLGAATARALGTKYVNQVYARLQNQIEKSEMLHQTASQETRNGVAKLLETHVILVKPGRKPKIIFKPLNWYQRLVIKAQNTRTGRTGLLLGRKRLNVRR